MKLSDAILLGSTMVKAQAGRQYSAKWQSGCALGMAAIARGCCFRESTEPYDMLDRRTLGTERIWGNWVRRSVVRPCACWRFWTPREMRIKTIITHIFDHHVMKKRDWTLEQLAAWVRTVEPGNSAPPPVGNPQAMRDAEQQPLDQLVQRLEQKKWEALTGSSQPSRVPRIFPRLDKYDA